MSVTRRRSSKNPRKKGGLATVRIGHRPITELKDLACFLNFQFESGGQEWTKLNHPLNLLLFRPRHPLGWMEAKELQAEILKDLLPVIAPEPWQIADLYALLESLVEKVNSLRLVNAWDIQPCDTRWMRRYGQQGWIIDSQSDVLQPIRPFERVVKAGGFKWLFRKTQVGATVRERLYSIVVDAIEAGELMELKKCQECPRIFVAEDPREKLCGPVCRKLHESKATKHRMRKYRRNQLKAMKRMGLPRLSKLARSNLSKIRQIFGEKFEDFIPYAEEVRSGHPPDEVWERLTHRIKKTISQAAL